MIKVVTIQHMRQIEREADLSGVSYAEMMHNAGSAAASLAKDMVSGIPSPMIMVIVGNGNNGGDGLVASHRLSQILPDAQIKLYIAAKREADPLLEAAQAISGFVATAEDDNDKQVLRDLAANSDLIIDAMFGIGIRLPIHGEAAAILQTVKQIIAARRTTSFNTVTIQAEHPNPKRHSRPLVLAIDCPSGLDCDSGDLDPQTIPADATITFVAAKPGLLTFPGAELTGKLFINAIGVPEDLPSMQEVTPIIVTPDIVSASLPERSANSNKGSYGKTLIVAGSANYIGAAGLAAEAAYRTGVGLVTAAVPQHVATALAATQPETTWLSASSEQSDLSPQLLDTLLQLIHRYDSILVGPGIGQSPATERFLLELFAQVKLIEPSVELIIDADALNLLARHDRWWELISKNAIITPHPGEMARLSQKTIPEIQADRINIAQHLSNISGVSIVLKGAHTVITDPSFPPAILPFKNDALATAGTGDILAGLIAGFKAQGLNAYNAALTGAYTHGLAGELTLTNSCSRTVIARDVLYQLPQALTVLSG